MVKLMRYYQENIADDVLTWHDNGLSGDILVGKKAELVVKAFEKSTGRKVEDNWSLFEFENDIAKVTAWLCYKKDSYRATCIQMHENDMVRIVNIFFSENGIFFNSMETIQDSVSYCFNSTGLH